MVLVHEISALVAVGLVLFKASTSQTKTRVKFARDKEDKHSNNNLSRVSSTESPSGIVFLLMTYLDGYAVCYKGHGSLDTVLDIETSQMSAPAPHILRYRRLFLLSVSGVVGVLSLNIHNV